MFRKAITTYNWPISLLLVFTLISVIGYTVFSMPPHGPEILAQFSDYPAIMAFYSLSFSFFGQIHVWLTAFALFYYLVRHVQARWVKAFVGVYLVSLISEMVGTQYGLPFGAYQYTPLLGAGWLGHVPYLIPLSWFTMAVPAYVLAKHIFSENRWLRWCLGGGIVLIWDFTLDPAMSYLTAYWIWEVPGTFYGMPYLNWFGWWFTGTVLMAVMEWTGADAWQLRISLRWMTVYYLAVLTMPVGMVLVNGMWEPLLLTALGLGFVYALYRMNMPTSFPRKIPEPAALVAPLASLEVLPPKEATRTYFTAHSRSFSFASNWFSAEDQALVQAIYTYCRFTDDLVDENPDVSPDRLKCRVDNWLETSRRAYEGHAVGIPWLELLMRESARQAVPFTLLEDFASGVKGDSGRVRMQTLAEMDRYGYQVASVVGLWMCHLFGVKDNSTLDRAGALGRAMQLTNILRDVGEDLARDRIYLPAELLLAYGIQEKDLKQMAASGIISDAYRSLIDHLIHRANVEYDKAWHGVVGLPKKFGNAVAIAATVYQGIHRGIIKNGYDNFTRRAYTSTLSKVLLAFRGRLKLYRARIQHRSPGKHETPLTRSHLRTTSS